MLLVLGLPALGEAGFRQASEDRRAHWIMVERAGRPVRAKLLMLGAAAMIYEAGGRRYLGGPRGEGAIEVGAVAPIRVAQPPDRIYPAMRDAALCESRESILADASAATSRGVESGGGKHSAAARGLINVEAEDVWPRVMTYHV